MAKRPAIPSKTSQPDLSITELGTKAEALEAKNDREGAVKLYRDWIKKSKSPLKWVAQFNLGVLLRNMGDMEGAIESYRASLNTNPKLPHARINLGTLLELTNHPDEAVAEWKTALKYLEEDPKADPGLVCTALNNLGRRLEVMKQYTEAEEALTRSLKINPDQPAVLYHRIFLRQKQCEWPIYAPLPGITLEDQMNATSAVAMLSITDDPEVQLRTALSQVPGKIPKDLPKLAPAEGYAHDRLRIGYLSSNFGMHAVSILTAELYELHDRSRVEVWGFCWSPEDNTEMRQRVIKAMDHFVRIKDMTDEDAAKAIRAAEIDVLIDLQGLTAGCRPKILAYRPAPVQITYLGFPGTTGLPEVDYVLADRYIIPEESAKYFTEKPLYLPDCFQVNDRKRIASAPKSRAEYGLPEDAFVFCAFNNNIKFTPEFFACWMRIVERTPNSVLWLLADNERAQSNLEKYAEDHGVSRDRLVFAPRVPVADYLARFAVADLFLDLFPFNGGTTAADALWMGLPIVTCSGRSFASRMAGSLLHAIGLSELITTSIAEYEDLAVSLAADRSSVYEIRKRALSNRVSHPLFDTPAFVKNMEALLFSVSIGQPQAPALQAAVRNASEQVSRVDNKLETLPMSLATTLNNESRIAQYPPIFVTQPFLPPLQELIPYLEKIWANKILTNGGPFHGEFEQALCEHLGVGHIALFSNGTLALLTALQTLRITGEVITTPYSFVATSHSLLWNGIKPIFVDIDPITLNLDPARIEAAITPQTTAIMPVHCYGHPCDVDAIQRIADNYNLKVIYDAAHAFGVRDGGGSILRHGDLSVLSFHATKTFTTFEGGAIVCSDAKTKQRIDHLKNFGFVDETTVVAPGINGKMSEFNAALGLLQLNYIEQVIDRRRQIDAHYRELLAPIKGIRCLANTGEITANYSYFPILVEPDYPVSRDELYNRLKSRGYHARRYFYPLISDFPMYRGLASARRDNLPIAATTAERILCLPIYPALEDVTIRNIVELISK